VRRRSLLSLMWLAVCAALATPLVAGAAPRVLLLYGPGIPGAETEAAARDQASPLLRGPARDAEAMHVSEVPFLGPAPMWASGDVDVQPCSGGLRSLEELRSMVERGKELTDLLEDVQAARTFYSAWAAMACADDFVPRDLMYDIHFYSGLSSYVAGDEDAAMAHFLEAVSTDPGCAFDPGYSPEIERMYNTAQQRWLDSEVLEFQVRDPAGVGSEVRLDGQPVRAGNATHQLSPGIHLLQFRSRFGTFTSLRIEAHEGGYAVLVSREGLLEALLDPLADDASLATARVSLAALAIERGVDGIVGSVLGEPGRLYRYDVVNGGLEELPLPKNRVSVKPPPEIERAPDPGPDPDPPDGDPTDPAIRSADADPPERAPDPPPAVEPDPDEDERIVLPPSHTWVVVGSVGWFYYPLEYAEAERSSYANVGVLAEIAFNDSLVGDFGFWVAVKGSDDSYRPEEIGSGLGAIRLGVRVNVAPWPVRPYLGGAVHFALHSAASSSSTDDSEVRTGGVGIAGLSIDPGEHLRIQLDVHAGFGASFILQTTAGIGVRF
jgi:hypothetical protein